MTIALRFDGIIHVGTQPSARKDAGTTRGAAVAVHAACANPANPGDQT